MPDDGTHELAQKCDNAAMKHAYLFALFLASCGPGYGVYSCDITDGNACEEYLSPYTEELARLHCERQRVRFTSVVDFRAGGCSQNERAGGCGHYSGTYASRITVYTAATEAQRKIACESGRLDP